MISLLRLFFWLASALGISSIAFACYLGYEISKMPDLYDVSFTFEDMTHYNDHTH